MTTNRGPRSCERCKGAEKCPGCEHELHVGEQCDKGVRPSGKPMPADGRDVTLIQCPCTWPEGSVQIPDFNAPAPQPAEACEHPCDCGAVSGPHATGCNIWGAIYKKKTECEHQWKRHTITSAFDVCSICRTARTETEPSLLVPTATLEKVRGLVGWWDTRAEQFPQDVDAAVLNGCAAELRAALEEST